MCASQRCQTLGSLLGTPACGPCHAGCGVDCDLFCNRQGATADALSMLTLVIETLAGVDGKLFGSVTPLMVANELSQHGYEIDRRQISLPLIKEVGEYVARVTLGWGFVADVRIIVVAKQD